VSGDALWPAPAKINLFLHVLARRSDGYHEIQTCYQFVDFGDDLSIHPRRDAAVNVEYRGIEAGKLNAGSDLVARSARALQKASGCLLGADIEVIKRIPIGGGLGGGSSDAATTLVALNHLWRLFWPRERLAQVGLTLGADVPVFIFGRAAWAEGVGERLTPLLGNLAPEEPVYLIAKPDCAVSTAEIFQAPELTRNSAPITITGFLANGGRNDCTETVRVRYPAVARVLDELSSFGQVRLTGTGACVFLVCESLERAQIIQRQLPSNETGFIARGMNESPLVARLIAAQA
jgi:4-diphosphocytidyl-2-C-methyl-D-erythritol kinase